MKFFVFPTFIILLFVINFVLLPQNEPNVVAYAKPDLSISVSSDTFYKKQCGFCHTSEELIAPDMNKIKNAYKAKYPQKTVFIKALVGFVENPSKKSAIYKEGIDSFPDMPKMPFKDVDIKAVAAYIYDTDNL